VSCDVCSCPRGSNKFCWGHVNSDGSGYSLPPISEKQLIRSRSKRRSRVSVLKKATLTQSKLRGDSELSPYK